MGRNIQMCSNEEPPLPGRLTEMNQSMTLLANLTKKN